MQIACSHCGATYVFDAALIPTEGYDARCTSCQAVFFVHPSGGGQATASAHPAPSRPVAAQKQGDAAHPEFSAASLHQGTMELDLSDEAAPTGVEAARKRTPAIDVDLDLGQRFAHNAPQASRGRGRGRDRHGAEADNEPLLMRRPWARRGLFLGVALVAVVGSGVVVGVVLSKRLHAPPSVQPPIHIVRAPDPIAAEAFNRGIKALWDDTSKSYVAAAKAFDAACARDPEFTDAWAGAALASLLYGADVEAQAQAALRTSVAQTKAALSAGRAQQGLNARTSDTEPNSDNDGDDDAAASTAQAMRQAAALSSLVQQGLDQVQALQAQALSLQRRGASLLLHGERLVAQTPLMAAAQAMWYAADPLSQNLAREQLRAFEQLTGGDCVPVEADPNSCSDGNTVPAVGPSLGPKVGQAPYGPLALWIEARLKAQDKNAAPKDVVAAYESALTLQPELRRARWELAQFQTRVGRADVAQPLLQDLAHSDAPHDKARAELQRLTNASRSPGTAP